MSDIKANFEAIDPNGNAVVGTKLGVMMNRSSEEADLSQTGHTRLAPDVRLSQPKADCWFIITDAGSSLGEELGRRVPDDAAVIVAVNVNDERLFDAPTADLLAKMHEANRPNTTLSNAEIDELIAKRALDWGELVTPVITSVCTSVNSMDPIPASLARFMDDGTASDPGTVVEGAGDAGKKMLTPTYMNSYSTEHMNAFVAEFDRMFSASDPRLVKDLYKVLFVQMNAASRDGGIPRAYAMYNKAFSEAVSDAAIEKASKGMDHAEEMRKLVDTVEPDVKYASVSISELEYVYPQFAGKLTTQVIDPEKAQKRDDLRKEQDDLQGAFKYRDMTSFETAMQVAGRLFGNVMKEQGLEGMMASMGYYADEIEFLNAVNAEKQSQGVPESDLVSTFNELADEDKQRMLRYELPPADVAVRLISPRAVLEFYSGLEGFQEVAGKFYEKRAQATDPTEGYFPKDGGRYAGKVHPHAKQIAKLARKLKRMGKVMSGLTPESERVIKSAQDSEDGFSWTDLFEAMAEGEGAVGTEISLDDMGDEARKMMDRIMFRAAAGAAGASVIDFKQCSDDVTAAFMSTRAFGAEYGLYTEPSKIQDLGESAGCFVPRDLFETFLNDLGDLTVGASCAFTALLSFLKSGHHVTAARVSNLLEKLLSSLTPERAISPSDMGDMLGAAVYFGVHSMSLLKLMILAKVMAMDNNLVFSITKRLYVEAPGTVALVLLHKVVDELDRAKFFKFINNQAAADKFKKAFAAWHGTAYLEAPYAQYLYGDSVAPSQTVRTTAADMYGYAAAIDKVMSGTSYSQSVALTREARSSASNQLVSSIMVEAFTKGLRTFMRRSIMQQMSGSNMLTGEQQKKQSALAQQQLLIEEVE